MDQARAEILGYVRGGDEEFFATDRPQADQDVDGGAAPYA